MIFADPKTGKTQTKLHLFDEKLETSPTHSRRCKNAFSALAQRGGSSPLPDSCLHRSALSRLLGAQINDVHDPINHRLDQGLRKNDCLEAASIPATGKTNKTHLRNESLCGFFQRYGSLLDSEAHYLPRNSDNLTPTSRKVAKNAPERVGKKTISNPEEGVEVS